MPNQMENSAPHKCLQCNSKLAKPCYEAVYLPSYRNYFPLVYEMRWACPCTECKTVYVWTFPNVWQERHPLEIFDSKLVLPQHFDFYGRKLKHAKI